MCGRITLTANILEIKEHFAIKSSSGAVLVCRYNIAPSQLLLIVKNNQLEFFQWGIKISTYNKSNYIINAKIETVLEKKLFNIAFKKQRCLVVGSGFFEWKLVNNKKVPYYIQIKNQNLLGFGGIIVNNSCIILTTQSNFTNFHPRLPVIIQPKHYNLWLNEKTSLTDLIDPKIQIEQNELYAYPVSSQVNNIKLDNIFCIKSLV